MTLQKEATLSFAGENLVFRTKRFALLSDGACELIWGDTVVLATANMGGHRDGADFFPLSVDYQERFYATGKIKGSRFIKREGRPSDTAVLISRLIDRPIRPMFPKGMLNEVQILCTVLSAQPGRDPGVLCLNAASMALMLSGMPFEGPVSAVTVGYRDGAYILFPTDEDLEKGDLDLTVAGTMDAITMVEAGAKELPDEIMLGAFEFAHKHIKELCEAQNRLKEQCQIPKPEYSVYQAPADADALIAADFTDELIDSFYGLGKKEFYAKLGEVETIVIEKHAAKLESGEWSKSDVSAVIKDRLRERMRERVLREEKRLDNRKIDEVRPVTCGVGVLPRTHGSGLFQRGDTQILTVTTLGGPQDAQMVDEMMKDYTKRYIHHYYFPPFAVGEVKPMRGVSRREIGHGYLAERALEPVLPKAEDFAYTMYLVSETLTCNGSSSMGSVCGSTLSLMDAGVPIKAPVVGIAMGLVSTEDGSSYKILSDIQAQEDFLGDMDFKVAGTDNGLTALQMDIKLQGLTIDLLRKALQQSKVGRDYIWSEMAKSIAAPRKELSQYAPMLFSFKIDPESIRFVIGKGGETIQKITAEHGVEINIEDDGTVTVTASDQQSGLAAVETVKRIVYVPLVGDKVTGKVVKILEFGALVEIAPGKVGMVHISELDKARVAKVEDVVKEGDTLEVKVLSVERDGKIGLSRKALLK